MTERASILGILRDLETAPDINTTDYIEDNVDEHASIYRGAEVSRVCYWIHLALIWICFAVLLICIKMSITGTFVLYFVFVFGMSLDFFISIQCCNYGVCCKYTNPKYNKLNDVSAMIAMKAWISSLIIILICQFCNAFSGISYSKSEELLPLIPMLILLVLVLYKLRLFYSKNWNEFHESVPKQANKWCNIWMPFQLIFLRAIFGLALIQIICHTQKTYFLYHQKPNMISTKDYGLFEYNCVGDVEPSKADIRIINVGGYQSLYTAFGWLNELMLNEYNNISICDYNRGGFGFTPLKKFGDKSIKSEVEHVIQIADALFGDNKPFHLNGHSRGGLILLQAKMKYPDRILSIAMFDTVLNSDKLNDPTYDIDWSFRGRTHLLFMGYSLGLSSFPQSININALASSLDSDAFKPELSGKYYSFRNYIWQQSIWELYDMEAGTDNTQEIYDNKLIQNNSYSLEPEWIVECEYDYDDWRYQNNILYAVTGHVPCVYDKEIINKIFNYPVGGLKAFYDSIL